jgi:hypothetical protein
VEGNQIYSVKFQMHVSWAKGLVSVYNLIGTPNTEIPMGDLSSPQIIGRAKLWIHRHKLSGLNFDVDRGVRGR